MPFWPGLTIVTSTQWAWLDLVAAPGIWGTPLAGHTRRCLGVRRQRRIGLGYNCIGSERSLYCSVSSASISFLFRHPDWKGWFFFHFQLNDAAMCAKLDMKLRNLLQRLKNDLNSLTRVGCCSPRVASLVLVDKPYRPGRITWSKKYIPSSEKSISSVSFLRHLSAIVPVQSLGVPDDIEQTFRRAKHSVDIRAQTSGLPSTLWCP